MVGKVDEGVEGDKLCFCGVEGLFLVVGLSDGLTEGEGKQIEGLK